AKWWALGLPRVGWALPTIRKPRREQGIGMVGSAHPTRKFTRSSPLGRHEPDRGGEVPGRSHGPGLDRLGLDQAEAQKRCGRRKDALAGVAKDGGGENARRR